MKFNIDVSVIIVSWNVSKYLEECIESLYACSEICFHGASKSHLHNYSGEIIVVDSASNDNTLEALKRFPNIIVLPQNQNIGYSKGNNIGAKSAKGEFLFILNPDTLVYSNTMGKMIEYMRADVKLGACSPWISNSNGYVQIPKKFPSLLGVIFCLPIFKSYPKKLLEKETLSLMPYGDFTTVEWIDGCSFFTRRNLFLKINGFDEVYTMFSEEKDLCQRMKKLGWGKMIVIHDINLLHYGGKSTESNIVVRHLDYWLGELVYFKKYHSKLETVILKISILFSYIWLYFLVRIGISRRFSKIYLDIFKKTITRVIEFKVNE